MPSSSCSNTCTKAVYPRITLAGCTGKDGFNGYIPWNNQWVSAWREVWYVSGTTASAWLHWYSPNVHNSNIGQAPAFTTTGVNFPRYGGMLSPGHISITVCAWWNVWECGTPVNVQR